MKLEEKERAKRKVDTSQYGRYAVRSLVHHGCNAFAQFERTHLTTQQRSSDPKHNALVQKLARGDPIDIEDLENYKYLSREDTDDPNGDWKFAPVLVSTNRERMTITQRQAILFAQHHQTYVFKWQNKLGSWKNKPADTTALFENNPLLYQHFVRGADAFLTKNINPHLGLANGTPVTCHSIVLDPDSPDFHSVMSKITGEGRLPYGSEIILEKPPLAVNMKVLIGLDGKQPSKQKQRQLKVLRKHSVAPEESDDIIIPVTYAGDKTKTVRMRNDCPSLNNVTSVVTTTALAYDLAFAMTG
jgi:hypothetical protein